MGVRIAGEEPNYADDIAVLGITNDHWSSRPRLDEADAAQDQSAHDALAELGLRHQHGPQPLGWDGERFYRAFRVGVDQRRAPRQLRQLAHECTGLVSNYELTAAGMATLGDVDCAL
jgi:hypothetical protein